MDKKIPKIRSIEDIKTNYPMLKKDRHIIMLLKKIVEKYIEEIDDETEDEDDDKKITQWLNDIDIDINSIDSVDKVLKNGNIEDATKKDTREYIIKALESNIPFQVYRILDDNGDGRLLYFIQEKIFDIMKKDSSRKSFKDLYNNDREENIQAWSDEFELDLENLGDVIHWLEDDSYSEKAKIYKSGIIEEINDMFDKALNGNGSSTNASASPYYSSISITSFDAKGKKNLKNSFTRMPIYGNIQVTGSDGNLIGDFPVVTQHHPEYNSLISEEIKKDASKIGKKEGKEKGTNIDMEGINLANIDINKIQKNPVLRKDFSSTLFLYNDTSHMKSHERRQHGVRQQLLDLQEDAENQTTYVGTALGLANYFIGGTRNFLRGAADLFLSEKKRTWQESWQ